ncbi:MAG TPA: circadian clock KaiB family protein [Ferruginibacter sp.]|nr:circadian clock KaiB family protein [Ferruginibacter sp.]
MPTKLRNNTKARAVGKASIIAAGKVHGKEKFILRLFVTGNLPNSSRAIININTICKKHLKNRYELEIIDIYQQPSLAFIEDIIAVPVLIKKFPLPEKRLIGDLSDSENVLKELGII